MQLENFNEFQQYTTPSDIIEFNYCKRFTYFMKVLGIDQHEEKSFKVLMGRDIHEKRIVNNKNYIRKSINAVGKDMNVNLVSNKYKLRGIVDEVLTLKDDSLAILDYKFSLYDEKIYKTVKTQMYLYSIMVDEVYNTTCSNAYVVYTRDGNKVVQLDISQSDKSKAVDIVNEYYEVLEGYYPIATKTKSRCVECTYRKICVK